MKEHYYELKHFYDGREMVMKFDGDINIEQLRENLGDFLRGACWCEENIAKIFNEDGDDNT